MAQPYTDLIVNVLDPTLSGLLVLGKDGQVTNGVARIPKSTRNDGAFLRIRAVRPDTTGLHQFADVDLTSVTVRVAIGAHDAVPGAGTWYLKSGSTSAAGVNYNATAGALQSSLNNALGAGSVTVTKPLDGFYYITWVATGTQTLLTSVATGLVPLTTVTVARVQTGSSTLQEVQAVQLQQNVYALKTSSWSAFDSAAATITQEQTGTASLPSIQSVTLDPAPYGGVWSVVIAGSGGGTYTNLPWNISATDLQSKVGPAVIVTRPGSNKWTFEYRAAGAQGALTATVSSLTVPLGVYGELNLNTTGLMEAFSLTSRKELQCTLELELQWSGQSEPQTVLSVPVIINRDVINPATVTPVTFTAYEPYLGLPGSDGYVLSSTALGVRSWIASTTSINTGKTLWVDSVNGVDSTGARGVLTKPYLTLGAAKTAATSGDTVRVLAGTYNENNLAKNGVNWWLDPGANITYTGSNVAGIFDDSAQGANGAVTFTVTGGGNFTFSPSGASGTHGGINISNASSNVTITCNNIVMTKNGATDGGPAIYQQGGVLRIVCRDITSDGANTDNSRYCAWWTDGDLSIKCRQMHSANGSTIYTSGSSVITGSGWIEADLILNDSGTYGCVSHDMTDASSRLWVIAKEIRNAASSTSKYVVRCTGGKLYIIAEKVAATDTTGRCSAFINGTGTGTSGTGGTLWASVQKVTATEYFLNSNNAAATTYADFLLMDGVVTVGLNSGGFINIPGGTVFLRGQSLSCADNLYGTRPVINVSGGSLTLSGVAITSVSSANDLTQSSGTLTVLGCKYDSSKTSGTITQGDPKVATALQPADIGSTVQAYDADLTTWAGITPGTGVGTALGINVGSAGAFVTFNGALGTPSGGTVTNLTGTASININGTVGATTPAVGTFTTLTSSSTTTLTTPIGKVSDAVTNANSVSLTLKHNTSGTAAASFGNALDFDLDSTTTADQSAARISALWTTATHASRTSDLVFYGVSSASALTESFRITGGGRTVNSSHSGLGGDFGFEIFSTLAKAQTRDVSGRDLTLDRGGLHLANTSGILFSSRAVNSGTDTFQSVDFGFFRATNDVGEFTTGSQNGTGSTWRAKPLSTSQITADQNNYSPATPSYYQRWNTDASHNITGLTFSTATQVDGQTHVIANVGSFNIVLINESASSTAANRFHNSTGADITLAPDNEVNCWYDATTARWRVTKRGF